MPIKDISSPPVVPAANGNQKFSFSNPIMNGRNPNNVDNIVSKIGMIL